MLYDHERAERAALGFPPYARLVNIVLSGTSALDVEAAARSVGAALTADLGAPASVVGPSPAPIARLKGQWRWHVVVKSPGRDSIAPAVGAAVARVRLPTGVTLITDVDPVGML
jgi:primosomal protein N' (replication factor Y)